MKSGRGCEEPEVGDIVNGDRGQLCCQCFVRWKVEPNEVKLEEELDCGEKRSVEWVRAKDT